MIAVLAVISFVLGSGPATQSSWPLWTRYVEHFVQRDGRVVDHDRDEVTTSEGQSYAMFFALVANDPASFDLVYQWSASHLANGSVARNLPAWSWGRRPDGTWGVKDSNSASDADIWMAYDLIQAGRLWKRPDYTSAGEILLKLIASKEVFQVHGSPVLLPGQTGFERDGTVALNPSYMPLFLFQAAAQAQPSGPWSALAASLPWLLREGSIAGFASDWLELTPEGIIRPIPAPDSGSARATGSYDAIRVYLWSGITSSGTPGRAAVLKEISSMATYMRGHAIPPEVITEGRPTPTGTGPISYSAALIPFLQASQAPEAAAQQERRLNLAWSSQSGLYGDPPRYYDQNLSMFALGFMEHRYRIRDTGELEVSWQR
ncbi:cellulose synthase complex periplasmic endoglucanase BcsZ [Tunturiibacter lichenicola]|uniref:cellulose synthase complex periplasmic endoglucanase BcsZ n=1 Tax=Tunturiibacter lichenicola TaxID=2051959 RepID=UPI003D9B2F41